MQIEALHNQTGKWITLSDEIAKDDFDEAMEQIAQPMRGCNSVIIIWGVTVKIDDFSAYRVSDT